MKTKFKVGDRVRVAKKYVGNYVSWVARMDEYIGKEYTLSYVDSTSVKFKDSPDVAHPEWLFPIESIETAYDKFIDGVAMTKEEFTRRTAPPVEMTAAEVLQKFNVVVIS